MPSSTRVALSRPPGGMSPWRPLRRVAMTLVVLAVCWMSYSRHRNRALSCAYSGTEANCYDCPGVASGVANLPCYDCGHRAEECAAEQAMYARIAPLAWPSLVVAVCMMGCAAFIEPLVFYVRTGTLGPWAPVAPTTGRSAKQG